MKIILDQQSDLIITFNKGDFEGIEKFSLKVLTPKEFLKLLGEIK